MGSSCTCRQVVIAKQMFVSRCAGIGEADCAGLPGHKSSSHHGHAGLGYRDIKEAALIRVKPNLLANCDTHRSQPVTHADQKIMVLTIIRSALDPSIGPCMHTPV